MFRSSARAKDTVPRRRHPTVRENDPYEKITTASDRIVAGIFAQLDCDITDDELKRLALLSMAEQLGDLYTEYLRPVICRDIERSIQKLLDRGAIIGVPEEVFGPYVMWECTPLAYRVQSTLHRLALLDL